MFCQKQTLSTNERSKRMKKSIYSTISYVAATLLLSGSVLANPADVSGVSNPQTSTDDSYSAEAYMAYNMYSALQKQLYSAEDGWYTEFENEFYDALSDRIDEMISSEMSY